MAKSKSTTNLAPTGKKHEPKTTSIKVVLAANKKKADPLIKKLNSFQINCAFDVSKAIELTKELKGLGKEAERQLGTIVDPTKRIIVDAKASIKAATELFDPFFEQINSIDSLIKERLMAYREKQTKIKDKLTQQLESGAIAKPSTYLKKVAEVESDEGVRKTWTAVCVDEALTPREYLVPDLAKIKEKLKSGGKVKGWEWKQVESIAI